MGSHRVPHDRQPARQMLQEMDQEFDDVPAADRSGEHNKISAICPYLL